MATILITGFEPFGGERHNPSQDVVRALEGRRIAGRTVVGVVLPCVFGRSLVALEKSLRQQRPELVLCLGLAAGRTEITPERVAINVSDARIADNAGRRPIDVPVVRGGPAAYWSTLPVKAIVAALRARGMPAAVSQSAGTFVCNHVFYGLMHALRRRRGVKAGFVHIPWATGQAPRGQPGLPLATLVEAVALTAEVALRTRGDRRLAGGANH